MSLPLSASELIKKNVARAMRNIYGMFHDSCCRPRMVFREPRKSDSTRPRIERHMMKMKEEIEVQCFIYY